MAMSGNECECSYLRRNVFFFFARRSISAQCYYARDARQQHVPACRQPPPPPHPNPFTAGSSMCTQTQMTFVGAARSAVGLRWRLSPRRATAIDSLTKPVARARTPSCRIQPPPAAWHAAQWVCADCHTQSPAPYSQCVYTGIHRPGIIRAVDIERHDRGVALMLLPGTNIAPDQPSDPRCSIHHCCTLSNAACRSPSIREHLCVADRGLKGGRARAGALCVHA